MLIIDDNNKDGTPDNSTNNNIKYTTEEELLRGFLETSTDEAKTKSKRVIINKRVNKINKSEELYTQGNWSNCPNPTKLPAPKFVDKGKSGL